LLNTPNLEDMARWSPEGDLLAVIWEDANADVYFVGVAGEFEVTQLTDAPGIDYMADWSPDGDRIVFVSDRGGNMDLWIMDADGGNPVQLTDTPDVEEGWPSWS
jgi:TolB protein